MKPEFTQDEKDAIEQAANYYLSSFFNSRDAEEIVYDLVKSVRPAIIKAALESKANEEEGAHP